MSLVRIASRYKQTSDSSLRRPCVCADKPPQRLFPVAAAAATKNLFSAGAGGRKRRGRSPRGRAPPRERKRSEARRGGKGGPASPPPDEREPKRRQASTPRSAAAARARRGGGEEAHSAAHTRAQGPRSGLQRPCARGAPRQPQAADEGAGAAGGTPTARERARPADRAAARDGHGDEEKRRRQNEPPPEESAYIFSF